MQRGLLYTENPCISLLHYQEAIRFDQNVIRIMFQIPKEQPNARPAKPKYRNHFNLQDDTHMPPSPSPIDTNVQDSPRNYP